MISENTTVISPSNLTPNHPDLLDFSIARSLRSASCDIKSTDAPQEAKTCDASKLNLSIQAHPTTDLPLIAVEDGHASKVVQKGEAWHLTSTGNRRRSYAGRPISYTISDADRAEAYSRWRHAERRRTPFTRFVTLKPPTDHLDPVERIALWDKVRQRYRCFCQDCKIECVMMRTRESNPKDSKGEHLHLLIAIPPAHQATFDRLAPRWFPNTDVRPTNHDERITSSGKVKSGFGYCHKAVTPQAARRNRSIWYRRSGAILGERSWSTRNLHQKARGQHDLAVRAAVRLHRERISIEPAVAAQLQAASASVAVLPAGIVCDEGGQDLQVDMAFATAATRAAVAPMRLATVVTMSLVLWDMGRLPSRLCAQIGHKKTLESRPAPTFTHQKEEAENPHHDLIL